ncbi:MAG: transcription-repair coupling factor, partial [Pseudomonadota bacterium]
MLLDSNTLLKDAVESLPGPRPGTVYALPSCHGSSDALLLALLASRECARSRPILLVTASAADAPRLREELAWLAPQLRCGLLPDWETLPYDAFSPHDDLISERLASLHAMQAGECDVLVSAVTTILHRLAPPSFVAGRSFRFRKGQQLDENRLRAQLSAAGYEHVSQVVHPGEYCVRGGLIDLYPMGSTMPYRLDLFGEELESIRTFDPDTQRSVYPVNEIRLLPGREFPIDEAARNTFRSRWRERFEGDPSRSAIYRDIGNGLAPAGIEYWLPLFHEQTADIFDYLGEQAIVITHGDVAEAGRRFADDVVQRHRFLAHDVERPLLRPDELFIAVDSFFAKAKALGRWSLGRQDSASEPERSAVFSAPLPELAINRRAERPLARLENFLNANASRALIVAESAGRRETLAELFRDHQLSIPALDSWDAFVSGDVRCALTVAPLHDGFSLDQAGIALITETELFAGAVRRTRRGSRESQSNIDAMIRDLAELKPGDPVVHVQHGIGRYQGLVNMDLGDGPTEFLHLVYAGDTTLY